MKTTTKPLPLAMVRFCTALRFLTVIPISWRSEADAQQFNRCLSYFPFVGILVGAIGYLLTSFFLLFLPLQVVSVLILVYLAGISGFLHLDGLSDSADGLLSYRPREDCLRIMKDSRVGAMGVIVVVCVILAKYSALTAMSSSQLLLAVFIIPLAGRSAILFTMYYLPYARSEGGIGSLFYSENNKLAATVGLILLLAFLIFLAPSRLLTTVAVILAVVFAFGRWCRRQLGGATGDTLGAVCELTEMAVAVSFTASFS